jgi:hypothetical protein
MAEPVTYRFVNPGISVVRLEQGTTDRIVPGGGENNSGRKTFLECSPGSVIFQGNNGFVAMLIFMNVLGGTAPPLWLPPVRYL